MGFNGTILKPRTKRNWYPSLMDQKSNLTLLLSVFGVLRLPSLVLLFVFVFLFWLMPFSIILLYRWASWISYRLVCAYFSLLKNCLKRKVFLPILCNLAGRMYLHMTGYWLVLVNFFNLAVQKWICIWNGCRS